MEYTIPLRITVDVKRVDQAVAAAKAESQRKFQISDEEWDARERPFIDQQFGHALGILLTSDAVCDAVRSILERTVTGLRATGFSVDTSEVSQTSAD